MPTVREFLDDVNRLFGFYFDALMAFHRTRKHIESLQKRFGSSDDSDFLFGKGTAQGTPEEMFAKSIHATTLGALKSRMATGGEDIQLAAHAMIVFTFHLWEEKYRTSLTDDAGNPISDLNSDIMGDLRLLRNAIIHNKGIADSNVGRCKVIKRFAPNQPIVLNNEIIYEIIRAIRSDFEPRA